MPVIREQRQFGVTPVRINRVDTGGQLIGEAVARAGQRLASDAFEQAAIVAEEKGQKAGLAATSADVARIDPNTGLPVAYSAPKGFGLIASRAYQNMIDRRFEESVLAEIKERGAEFASSSSSAAEYKERLTNYVTSMYEGATGDGSELNAYGRIVQELGSEYVASTYEVLAGKEAEARRAALIRQRTIAAIENERVIYASLAYGLDASEQISTYSQDALDLFSTGAITPSDFKQRIDRVDGWAGIAATSGLSSVYNSLTPEDRKLFVQAINNPAQAYSLAASLGNPAIPEMIVAARIGSGGSPEAVIGVLENRGEAYDDSRDAAISTISNSVTDSVDTTNFVSVYSVVNSMDLTPDVKDAVIGNIISQSAVAILEARSLGTEEYNKLIVELEKVNPNYAEVSSILGGGTEGENFSMSLRRYTSPEVRAELAQSLKDRTIVMSKVENAEEEQIANEMKMSILDLNDPANAKGIEEKIRSLNPPNAASLLGSLRERTAILHINSASDINVSSLNGLQRIENAVLSGGQAPAGASAEDKAIYEYYREAYRENPASTKAAMSSRIEGYRAEIEYQVVAVQTARAFEAARGGVMPNADDLALMEAEIFPYGAPKALTELSANGQVVSLLDSGIVLPAVGSALSRLLFSTNEAEINAGLDLFRKYSLGEVSSTSGVGGTQRIDILKAQLPSSTYNDLAAISFIYDQTNQPPILVRQAFVNAGGAEKIDAAIGSILGAKPMAVYASTAMSPAFREELAQVLRYHYAMNGVISEDSATAILKAYKDTTAKDRRVVGPLLDDKTAHAIAGRMTDMEVARFETQLRANLADDFESRGFLKDIPATGGMQVWVASGARFLAEFIGDEETVKNMEIEEKAALVDFVSPVVYRPVYSAFASGIPTWEAGYMTNVNGIELFQPYVINGIPAIMQKDTSSYDQSAMRRTAVNTWASSLRYPEAAVQNESYVRYLATLEHMDFEFFKNSSQYQEIYEVLGEETDSIFQEQRDRYTNEPWKYR